MTLYKLWRVATLLQRAVCPESASSKLGSSMKSYREAMDLYFGIPWPLDLKYRLLCKYKTKLSPRLLAEKAEIERLAPQRAKELFSEELQKRTYLLDQIAKKESWSGGYLPIPIKF